MEEILIKPLITEKASKMGENKVVFLVSKKATKGEIKKAIFKFYKVKPTKINIINVKGKRIRYRGIVGKRKDLKKAIVTLKKGERIEIK